jgi:hypothetical protein
MVPRGEASRVISFLRREYEVEAEFIVDECNAALVIGGFATGFNVCRRMAMCTVQSDGDEACALEISHLDTRERILEGKPSPWARSKIERDICRAIHREFGVTVAA